MPPGRQSKRLSDGQIRRLSEYRSQRRLSLPQLKLAMDAPFRWHVLKRALAGEPIWEFNHLYIVSWINVHIPEKPPAFDGKAAAAGEFVQREGN